MNLSRYAPLIVAALAGNILVTACYSIRGGGNNALAGGGAGGLGAGGDGGGAPVHVPEQVTVPCNFSNQLQPILQMPGKTMVDLGRVTAFAGSDLKPTEMHQRLTNIIGESVTIQGDCGAYLDELGDHGIVVFVIP